MTIAVLTPDKEVFQGEIQSLTVPGTSGEFQILSNHAPIVSSLQAGKVSIKKASGEMMNFRISSGFVEVLSNNVALLVQGME